VLLAVLVADARLDDAALDELLAAARKLADQLNELTHCYGDNGRPGAALRAYLTARTEKEPTDAERGFLTLYRTDHVDGIGDPVYGAFVAAARRRFAPAWTLADIVRFVADFRSSSAEAASLLSTSAAENQLRGVLGEQQARPARSDAGAMLRCWSLG
jgi:hypothetical protein